ncbi:hypothetical protein Nepgr_001956 [Nepenthes gracilis]|uniref:P-type ATPase A domain-containing protein n=1 Tax=Nepenthes gracilis TaxID=150966 RepID=A0AAD3P688_NEPGR|nr:hypothetical protein Nepgr_001956 [Nepenthes gracilis]
MKEASHQTIQTSLAVLMKTMQEIFNFSWQILFPQLRCCELKEATILVPEDLINIKLGDIVPADARLLEGDPLKIDQATITGVSLPFTENPGDETFAGPNCKQGKIEAVVMATGIYTLYGKAAHLVDSIWSLWPLIWLQKCFSLEDFQAMPTTIEVSAPPNRTRGDHERMTTKNGDGVTSATILMLVPIDASVVNMLGDPKEARTGIKGVVILLELCQTQDYHEQGVFELVMEKKQQPARSGTGVVVAIKNVNQESLQGFEEWQSVVTFLERLSHPNLMRSLGYSLGRKGVFACL